MNLFSLKVSDDYLCEGFKKNFNNIKKDNFLKKRLNFRKLVNIRLTRLNNELRKLNNLFLAPTNYFFSSREKEEVNEFIQNKIKECVFYKKQNQNILVLKDLLHKHNDLKMEMKSLENEIKSLANDI
tara:strand:+ start:640 stop:1020 length:381 start_codon:yes stop_codon:yes gene_type:complete